MVENDIFYDVNHYRDGLLSVKYFKIVCNILDVYIKIIYLGQTITIKT